MIIIIYDLPSFQIVLSVCEPLTMSDEPPSPAKLRLSHDLPGYGTITPRGGLGNVSQVLAAARFAQHSTVSAIPSTLSTTSDPNVSQKDNNAGDSRAPREC